MRDLVGTPFTPNRGGPEGHPPIDAREDCRPGGWTREDEIPHVQPIVRVTIGAPGAEQAAGHRQLAVERAAHADELVDRDFDRQRGNAQYVAQPLLMEAAEHLQGAQRVIAGLGPGGGNLVDGFLLG